MIRVQVFLGDLDPDAVQVELYADAVDDTNPVRQPMTREQALTGSVSGWLYRAEVPAARPAVDYTARLIPRHPAVRIPLEARRSSGSGDAPRQRRVNSTSLASGMGGGLGLLSERSLRNFAISPYQPASDCLDGFKNGAGAAG